MLFSVDGGRTYGAPKELTVKAADGSQRTADAADYTHIRWVLKAPLDAGAKGFARFRAVDVESGGAVDPADPQRAARARVARRRH